MFGSNDDKKAPAEAGEKKGLFGWFRKKPQPPAQAGAEGEALSPEVDVSPPVLLPLPLPLPLKSVAYQPLPFN